MPHEPHEHHTSISISLPLLNASPVPAAPEGGVLSTLNPDGTRRWLMPKLSPGHTWTMRRLLAWGLIVVFAAIPWLRLNDKPLILLDVMTRRFVFFGVTFRPTDTLLLALLILIVFVVVFLLTAILGRVWCGWACPQTIYMEFVYRPIERLFLGAGYSNRKSLVAPWRRVAMYMAFFVVSAHLANTFLAYFVGTDRLVEWTFGSPLQHPTAFAVFGVTVAMMMFDFCFFREQMCTLVCPYGRMQSVLLDRDSLIVGYDRMRGEPRGRKRAPEKKYGCDKDPSTGRCGGGCGCSDERKDVVVDAPVRALASARGLASERVADCVDCTLCVQTCPVGIDIRDGLQLECIHCAQCIDACDAVMTKLHRPTGLIRYSTQNVLERTTGSRWRPRLVVYPLLLMGLLSGFVYLLVNRADAMIVQLRVQGVPYTVESDGSIVNVLRVRVDNRTDFARTYTIVGGDGVVLREPVGLAVDGIASSEATLHILSRPSDFVRGHRAITLQIRDDGAFAAEQSFGIAGPFGSLASSVPYSKESRE
ncbi:MAG: 4Fe-4S dicluster domain-containing protein [Phycisphaerae bacterium]|nr:4Fe-4S dicluster domain-containing protein [Phycisphaerae bacterium]